MDDRGLDEFKGDVDFDFFDDEGDTISDVPPKDVVSGKPPAARKSPNPLPSPSSKKLPDLSLDLSKPKSKISDDSASDSDSDSSVSDDSYSSDSSVTDSDQDDRQQQKSADKNRSSQSRKTNNKNKLKSQQRSRSASSSGTGSESDSEGFSNVRSLQGLKNKKSRSNSENSDAYSDSQSNSDVECESKPVHVPSAQNSRPMTSHKSRSRTKHVEDGWTNGVDHPRKVKRPSDKESGKSRRPDNKNKGKKTTVSDSESEITDVSPLNSAPNSPKNKRKVYRNDSQRNASRQSETETLDLNILVGAVSELDKDQRIKANTRRVMFAPHKPNDRQRENYTYSNERAKMIEKENQRLLNEILHHVEMREAPVPKIKHEQPVIRRLTPSAINRERQQRKIERDNLAFLQRLKKIKPTKGMSKAEHDKEYNRTMLYGVPISVVHGSQHNKSRSSTPWDELSSSSRMGSRTRSLNSVHSAVSTSTLSSTQSTFRRPLSGKKDRRPEWNDRW